MKIALTSSENASTYDWTIQQFYYLKKETLQKYNLTVISPPKVILFLVMKKMYK